MCVDLKEIERIKSLQVGKKCHSCRVGEYAFFNRKHNEVRCLNCGEKPFKNY